MAQVLFAADSATKAKKSMTENLVTVQAVPATFGKFVRTLDF